MIDRWPMALKRVRPQLSVSSVHMPGLVLFALTIVFIGALAQPSIAWFASSENYASWHMLLEMVAIIVSAMIFTLGWNLRDEPDEAERLTILCGPFFAVAVIDILHTLSYLGMPAFITPSSAEKAINFWLMGRLVAAIGLLSYALLPFYRRSLSCSALDSLGLGILISFLAGYVGFYRSDWLPPTFIDGQGLTPFKIGAEYILIAINIMTALLFWRHAAYQRGQHLIWLATACYIMALSELFFTFYQTVSDLMNVMGHVFKTLAYFIIYHVLFVAGVRCPYNRLAATRQQLEHSLQELRIAAAAFETQQGIIITDAQKITQSVNHAFTRITGYLADEVVGSLPSLFKSGMEDSQFYREIWRKLECEYYWDGEIWCRRKDGEIFPVWLTITAITGAGGKVTHYIGTFSDIGDYKRIEQEKEELLAYNQSIIATLPDAVYLKDTEGRWRIANDIAKSLFRLEDGCWEGKTDAELGVFTPDLEAVYSRCQAMDDEAWRVGQLTFNELQIVLGDRQTHEFEVRKTPIFDKSGQAIGMLTISRDITERKRSEMELRHHREHLEELVAEQTLDLQRAKEKAEDANRTKSEFLANMSHEIRTPMNGVVGMVDILQTTELSRTQHRMVNTVRQSALALLAILDDILDYSKIEAGKLNIEYLPVNLRELAEGVAELMAPKAAAKNIDLLVFVAPACPDWVRTDPTRLRQMLLNLLGNAVKFTDSVAGRRGSVQLKVEPIAVKGAPAVLRCRVIDNGIGMSQDIIGLLFQPFSQADCSTTRRFGGTGLGLSITKRLTEMLHGEIRVNSQEGSGTEFIIDLPLDIDSAPADHGIPALPDLTGVTVWAVTRHPFYREMLPAYLGMAGAVCRVFNDPPEGLGQALRQVGDPSVLLLDRCVTAAVSLPEEIALAAQGIPIVRLIPRNASSGSLVNLTVAANPMTFQDLIRVVAVAAKRLTITESVELSASGRKFSQSAPTVAQAMASNHLVLIAEDNEINRDVLQEQLRLIGYAAEAAANGQEALDCWRSGRYALLLTDCHMPKLDGFQLAEAIRREQPERSRIPIIAVTANAMASEAERCLAYGMDDFIAKPVRLEKLQQVMAKWLPLAPPSAASSDQSETSHKEPLVAVWDETALSRMVGDNPELHGRLLDKFLVNAQQMKQDIVQAVACNDAGQVANTAHKFKSAARTVGAMVLGELCQAIESAGRSGDLAELRRLGEDLPATYAAAEERITQRDNK